jgi:tetratricopeptide (TPR) repeat protein
MADVVRECNEGVRVARLGAELRPDDSLAVGAVGFALAFLIGEVSTGIEFIDRSISLNPNDSLAWHASGWTRCYNGDHDLAIEHIGQAERLSPLDPQWSQFQLAKCMAHYCAGRYEEATALARTVVRRHPDLVAGHLHFARCEVMAGRLEEGRAAMTEALKLNPGLSLNTNSAFPLMQRPEDQQRIREGLRRAGMPE